MNVLDHGTSEYNQGKIGKCRSFVGSGYLELTNSFGIESDKDFSCCYWIKEISNNTLSGFRVVYQCGNLIIGHYDDEFNIYNGSDLDFVYKCDTTDWVHCCLTYQSSDNIMTIYINGIKCSTRQLKSLNGLSSATALIGKRNNETYLLEGYLNDFRLYDECLSPKQVKYISQAMICHYPMGNVDGKIGGRNLIKNSTLINGEPTNFHKETCNKCTLSYSKDGLSISNPSGGVPENNGISFKGKFRSLGITSGDTIAFSFDVKGSTDKHANCNIILQGMNTTGNWWESTSAMSKRVMFSAKQDEFSRFSVSLKIPDDISNFTNDIFWLQIHGGEAFNCIIKNIKLEKSSTSTPYTPAPEDNSQFYDNIIPDISGYQNNATVKDSTSPTWSDDSPRYLGSYKFDGKSQYINCGTNTMIQGLSEFTVNCWAYMDDWTKFNSRLFSCTENGGYNTEGLNGLIKFGLSVYTNADMSKYQYNSSIGGYPGIKLSDMSTGWHMITCVYKDSIGDAIYLDGNLYEKKTYLSYGVHYNMNANLFLGCESHGYQPANIYFNGNLSDFRIYATALSESDVLNLYLSSASLDSQGNLMLSGEVIE